MGIGVRMAKLGIHWTTIYKAVIEMDQKVFSDAERVNCIIECIPKEEERALFFQFLASNSSAAVGELTEAEQLGIQLLKIPRALERVTCCTYCFELLDQLSLAQQVLETHKIAYKNILDSKELQQIVLVVREIGNFMNYGTKLGDSCGFRTVILTRLMDTRATQGKSTLLRFVVEQMGPDFPLLNNTLQSILAPHMSIALKEVLTSLQDAEQYLNIIENEIDLHPEKIVLEFSVSEESEKIGMIFYYDHFQARISKKLRELTDNYKRMFGFYGEVMSIKKHLLNWFGEIKNDEQLVAHIAAFVKKFSQVQMQINQEQRFARQRTLRSQIGSESGRSEASVTQSIK